MLVVYGDKIFYETNLFSADPEFFNVFTYQFLEGEPSLALIDDKSLVITESIRKKYFGELAAIGKILSYNGEDRLISAVIEDPPINSHFHFNIIGKLISPSYNLNSLDTDWNGYNWYTYLKLKPKTDVTEFEKKLQGLIERNKVVLKANYFIQHLTDIHLHSNLKSELETNGSFSFNRILVYVGGFLLLVGIVNFINLSVVRVLFRAKEFGISKISGAMNFNLFFNFLSESFVLVFVSFNVAIILIYLILSSFNSRFGMMLSLNELKDPIIAITCFIILLVIGVLSTAFPALYFARLNLVKILKGGFNAGNHGVWLRKSLVVFQFIVTAVMISGNVIIYRQMDFLKNQDLGFDKEQILILPGISEDLHGDVVKEKFLQLPEVKKIAFASSLPGDQNMFFMAAAKGSTQNTIMDYAFVDYDYIDLLDLKITQGRNFSREYLTDETDFPLIINETAARILGLDGNAVGSEITPNPKALKPIYFKIIGVIKDFHFTTFHEEIKPFMLSLSPQGPNLILKLRTDKYSATLDKLENIWKENIKNIPFDYRFLDDSFYKKYKAEENLQIFFIGLTLVTMLIASSGLFAIATLLINKRKLEIAIRKVMGASTKNVYRLIGQEYVNLVSLSVLLSIPIAFILMKTWLENFVYRIDISIVDFVIVAFISVTLCLLIVSYQAVKIAIMDPLKTLRSE